MARLPLRTLGTGPGEDHFRRPAEERDGRERCCRSRTTRGAGQLALRPVRGHGKAPSSGLSRLNTVQGSNADEASTARPRRTKHCSKNERERIRFSGCGKLSRVLLEDGKVNSHTLGVRSTVRSTTETRQAPETLFEKKA